MTVDEFRQWAIEQGVNWAQCVQIAFTIDSVRAHHDQVHMEVTEYLTDGFDHRFLRNGEAAVSTRTIPLRSLPLQPNRAHPVDRFPSVRGSMLDPGTES